MSGDFESVALVDVSRHFGRRRAVSHVSMTARAGEIVGLLGPNGAGKSTLLNLLATLAAPTSGSIRFGDRESRGSMPALRRRIGLLAHELHLYPELTARQNLAFFAQLYGIDGTARVNSALEDAGLAERADEEVAGFSRGMRQRIALERALLHDPRLVLLDEPFTGLDDRAGTRISERLRRLAAAGAIVILATHDLDLAAGLVSRIVVIRDGRVASDEPATAELRARYRSVIGTRT